MMTFGILYLLYNNIMSIFRLIGNYFLWHYSIAFVRMFHIFGNLFWFLYHFFSIPVLFRTLFSPWKKIHEQRESDGFNLKDILSALIINTMMRIVGFFFRVILITISVISIIFLFLLSVFFFLFWVFAPMLILLSFVSGIIFLFK